MAVLRGGSGLLGPRVCAVVVVRQLRAEGVRRTMRSWLGRSVRLLGRGGAKVVVGVGVVGQQPKGLWSVSGREASRVWRVRPPGLRSWPAPLRLLRWLWSRCWFVMELWPRLLLDFWWWRLSGGMSEK